MSQIVLNRKSSTKILIWKLLETIVIDRKQLKIMKNRSKFPNTHINSFKLNFQYGRYASGINFIGVRKSELNHFLLWSQLPENTNKIYGKI